MPSIKDSLKKVVQAAKKERVIEPEALRRMRKIAEIARNESKTGKK